MGKSVAFVVFVTVKIKMFKEVSMKKHYFEPVIKILNVYHSDVLLSSILSDKPENHDDIFGGGVL